VRRFGAAKLVAIQNYASKRLTLSFALPIARDRSWRSLIAAVVALVLLLVSAAPAAFGQSLDKLEIASANGPHVFNVEIADNEVKREIGLMYRRFLPENRGMLFDFKEEAPVSFWMKNTYIPLDMVFISRRGVVTKIVANAEPLSETPIPSGGPVLGVLEINGGLAARLGIKQGDRVTHPIFKP
jgi:uncharacterized membrane protein (UPF0127 family)